MDTRRIFIIKRKIFLSIHLESIRKIDLLGKFRGRVGDLEDAI